MRKTAKKSKSKKSAYLDAVSMLKSLVTPPHNKPQIDKMFPLPKRKQAEPIDYFRTNDASSLNILRMFSSVNVMIIFLLKRNQLG